MFTLSLLVIVFRMMLVLNTMLSLLLMLVLLMIPSTSLDMRHYRNVLLVSKMVFTI